MAIEMKLSPRKRFGKRGQSEQRPRKNRPSNVIEIHEQQGPWASHDKKRGPEAPGHPLLDDWGKGDKH